MAVHLPDDNENYFTPQRHKQPIVPGKHTPVDITEDVGRLVATKILGGLGTCIADSWALQGWILKFREYRKKLRIHVKLFLTGSPIIIQHGHTTGHLCMASWLLSTNGQAFV